MSDSMLEYNPGTIMDYTAQVQGFSAEVEQIRTACHERVMALGAGGHFSGENANALDEVWTVLNSAFDEAQQTIHLHSQKVDNSLTNFMGQDAAGAASLRGA
ncbi:MULTISPECIES: WXG100 family type VII secretion target [Mycolicibacterium]|uniref:WXG100 family type VII secretion target n=1 Tax=Mycolicibacterium TaxID=1866885 RepID=UPI001E2FAD64|nr:WXG100 family type VII secretion target [Mycolicibacterium mageritense]MCC9184356.1 WXG100 family type VII secretion target [Mycolicibacterium mageritense]